MISKCLIQQEMAEKIRRKMVIFGGCDRFLTVKYCSYLLISSYQRKTLETLMNAAPPTNKQVQKTTASAPFLRTIFYHVSSYYGWLCSSNLNSISQINIYGFIFRGLIGGCFEPYLTIYIDAQDTNLNELIDR